MVCNLQCQSLLLAKILVVLSVLAGAWADEFALPVVACPDKAVVGTEFTARVEAANRATETLAGTLAIILPGDAFEVVSVSDGATVYDPKASAIDILSFVKSTNGWTAALAGDKHSMRDNRIEFYLQEWPSNESRTLTVRLRPLATGTGVIRFRSTFSRVEQGKVIIQENQPPTGPLDDMGLPCIERDIRVAEPAGALTSAKTPDDATSIPAKVLPEVRIQQGHNSEVTAAAYSHSGNLVLTGSADSMKIWELETAKLVRTIFFSAPARANEVCFSKHDDRIAATLSNGDETIQSYFVFDASSGQLLRQFTGDPDHAYLQEFSDSYPYHVALTTEHSIRVRNLLTGQIVFEKEFSGSVLDQRYLPEANKLAVLLLNDQDAGCTISVYSLDGNSTSPSVLTLSEANLGTGEFYPSWPYTLFAPDQQARSFLVGLNETTADGYYSPGQVSVWNLASGNPPIMLDDKHSWVTVLAVHPNRNMGLTDEHADFTASRRNPGAALWDLQSGEKIRSLNDNRIRFEDVMFSAKSNEVYGFGSYGLLKCSILNPLNTGAISFAHGPDRRIRELIASPTDRFIGAIFEWLGPNRSEFPWAVILDNKTGQLFESEIQEVEKEELLKAILSIQDLEDSDATWTNGILLQLSANSRWSNANLPSGQGRFEWEGRPDGIIVKTSSDHHEILRGAPGEYFDCVFAPDDSVCALQSASGYSLFRLPEAKLFAELPVTNTATEEEDKRERRVEFSRTGKYLIESRQCLEESSPKCVSSVRVWNVSSNELVVDALCRGIVGKNQISEESDRIVFAEPDGPLTLYDLRYGAFSRGLASIRIEVTENTVIAAISPDGKWVAYQDTDGSIGVYNLITERKLANAAGFINGDYLIWTPEGYMSGTENAVREQCHIVRGTRVFPADQAFNLVYNPAAVAASLRGEQLLPLDLNPLFDLGAPMVHFEEPKVTTNGKRIVSLLEAPSDDTVAKVTVNCEDSPIEEIRIYHNGKAVAALTAGQCKQLDSSTWSAEARVDLVPGANELKVVATAASRIESAPAVVQFIHEAQKAVPKLYVVAVGIDTYRQSALNLDYAVADADAFANNLKSTAQSFYSEIYTVVLDTPETTTRESILRALDAAVAQCRPTDVFCFFFSGHGSFLRQRDDAKYFLATSETTSLQSDSGAGAVVNSGISDAELDGCLVRIPALKQVLFLDSCNSGAVSIGGAKGALTDDLVLRKLNRSAGTWVFTASASVQQARESSSLKHGYFTQALLEGLVGAAEGSQPDGYIRLSELASFLTGAVERMTAAAGQPQYPKVYSGKDDFPFVAARQPQ